MSQETVTDDWVGVTGSGDRIGLIRVWFGARTGRMLVNQIWGKREMQGNCQVFRPDKDQLLRLKNLGINKLLEGIQGSDLNVQSLFLE